MNNLTTVEKTEDVKTLELQEKKDGLLLEIGSYGTNLEDAKKELLNTEFSISEKTQELLDILMKTGEASKELESIKISIKSLEPKFLELNKLEETKDSIIAETEHLQSSFEDQKRKYEEEFAGLEEKIHDSEVILDINIKTVNNQNELISSNKEIIDAQNDQISANLKTISNLQDSIIQLDNKTNEVQALEERNQALTVENFDLEKIHDQKLADIGAAEFSKNQIIDDANKKAEAIINDSLEKQNAIIERESQISLKEAALTDRENRLNDIKGVIEKIHGKTIKV